MIYKLHMSIYTVYSMNELNAIMMHGMVFVLMLIHSRSSSSSSSSSKVIAVISSLLVFSNLMVSQHASLQASSHVLDYLCV